jgi:hypothetical protein
MIGLIAHLVYWNVFGDRLNALPLDTYHKKLLFIQIVQFQSEFEAKYQGKRIFSTLHMPLMILAIRILVELIFKNAYSEFFEKEQHEKITVKLMNDVITHMLDSNLYYSRFSFLESGM